MKWDYHILKEYDMLISKGNCETADDRGKYIQ